MLASIVAQSDISEGVLNVVIGDRQAGALLAQQKIDMIIFTGSTRVGQELTKIAAEKFIPIATELGGSSPCIVFEDLEITEEVIAFIANMRFINSGQACDAVKRLIVHESKFDEVVSKLSRYIVKQKIGDAMDEDTVVGPMISQKQLELIEDQVEDAVAKGAKVITGGKRPGNLQGAYYLPTLLTHVIKDMKVWNEETFGPILPIVTFDTEEKQFEWLMTQAMD